MQAWLEVSLGDVVGNARELARTVGPAGLCAVVKSNAYGHGLVPITKALAAAGIADLRFAVFSGAEGLTLRAAGVAESILVLGPVADEELGAVCAAGLECAVLTTEDARRYHSSTRVHVKIESGISRFGVRPDEAGTVIEQCRRSDLLVVGLYSHLANAEDLDEAYTVRQLERLQSVPRERGVIAHIAASAAAIVYPQTRLDMVRCGIALYGRWPSSAVRSAPQAQDCVLVPALRWFAPVVQTRDVAAGERVGYGCDFEAQRKSTIAVLPIGYADGLPRAAGAGNLLVAIGGARAPIVGRICMNACMIDVTDVRPAITRGDVAELDIDDVARSAGTINYEILARLPESTERRYV